MIKGVFYEFIPTTKQSKSDILHSETVCILYCKKLGL